MKTKGIRCGIILFIWTLPFVVSAQPVSEPRILIDAESVRNRISRYLTGACIEDVNHEIYGGLYSQMIFGESFQEPVRIDPPNGFQAYGGLWRVNSAGEVTVTSGDGPKLISDFSPFTTGQTSVEVFLPDKTPGNAGLIVKVANAGIGADTFDGYEISLDNDQQIVRLGRHRHNWELIRDVPYEVPTGQWIELSATMTEKTIEVFVGGKSVIQFQDDQHPLRSGSVGLRVWQRQARYRNLQIKTGATETAIPFQSGPDGNVEVSGMWRAVKHGSARGQWTIQTDRPFVGKQSQGIAFVGGEGQIGIENQGLNRWGMDFKESMPYEGYVWVKAADPTRLIVALESRDGSNIYAQSQLTTTSNDWHRLDFSLTPGASDKSGRFTLKLKQPGSVVIGHAFLQPRAWGRFKNLPVRRDVTEAMIDQGITVLRYGGSMVNHPEYRWKNMIGPRDKRPPYQGTWYPYSSNGWGIIDFLDFCEAAGFPCIPAFNMGETPQDMIDFIEYVNGPADSPWGRKRAEDGHPKSYNLGYLQLGNEERVDEAYFQKFQPLAEAIWKTDPKIILVVGDFVYNQQIQDPFRFQGAASGITSLAAQQNILRLARQHDREVWFDIHVGTDGPRPDDTFSAMFSFADALDKIAEGAKHKVVVFEFNAGNHSHKRALANALAIQAIENDGRIPIAASANCLQPDGQNDNGWNQGLLFLNPSQVWLQPPGYVTRMVSRNYQPFALNCTVQESDDALKVNAKRSEDGKVLVVQAVHLGDRDLPAVIQLKNFACSKSTAIVEELSGPLDTVNSAEHPGRIVPTNTEWKHNFKDGMTRFVFQPNSFTILRFE